MEKVFKISESELIELLATSIEYNMLQAAGVDNWDSGGVVQEIFEEECEELDLPEPESGYWGDYSYQDLAREYLKDYQEVE